jgi:hypothetical protein
MWLATSKFQTQQSSVIRMRFGWALAVRKKSPWMVTSLESKPNLTSDYGRTAAAKLLAPTASHSKRAERSARGRARGSREWLQAGDMTRHQSIAIPMRPASRSEFRSDPRRAGLVAAPKSISRLSIAVRWRVQRSPHILPVGAL